MAIAIRGLVTGCVLWVFSVVSALAATGTVGSMSPAAGAFGPGGGAGLITVEASGPWTATTQASWIDFTSGNSFSGNGTMSFVVAPNTSGLARTGTIAVGNQLFTVRQPAATFLDSSDPSSWPYPYVNAITAAGLTNGCGNNNFCPADPVTREQMAAFVVRALRGENFTFTQQPLFTDVPPTSWSYMYVQKMKDLNLTANTGTFDPSGTLTREQMAAFVIRALYGENFTYPSTPYFTDVPPSQWSFKYVQKMKEQNLTANTGTFDPTGTVTRAQMATVMSRAFLGMMSSSTDVPSSNTAFMAGMIMGKSMQLSVPAVGAVTYNFNENGTFTATNMTAGMMNFSGKWMINDDGTMTLDNMSGMMPGYTETFTMMGGGGALPMTMNYMNSSGATGNGVMMMPM